MKSISEATYYSQNLYYHSPARMSGPGRSIASIIEITAMARKTKYSCFWQAILPCTVCNRRYGVCAAAWRRVQDLLMLNVELSTNL